MTPNSRIKTILKERQDYRDSHWAEGDPICDDRLLWQAQTFRHLVHALPGESVIEYGAGSGLFTKAISTALKNRCSITAVSLGPTDEKHISDDGLIERIQASSFPGPLEGRKFRYAVAHDLLDRETSAVVLKHLYDLLEDGGQVVIFQTNPWSSFYAVQRLFGSKSTRTMAQSLVNQPELYELISEVGFVKISARFTDFVYVPLVPFMAWLLKGLSVIFENMPFVRTLARKVFIHAGKPSKKQRKRNVSLCKHGLLKDAISVVIPCHNEEMNILPLLEGMNAYYGKYIHQIVLVDDNSTDGTRAVIEQLARKDPRISPVFRSPPNGVGRALSDGIAQAKGRYILSMDCDFHHLLPELEDMFDAAAEGYEVVFGSRFSRHSILINYPFGKVVCNRAFHLVFNILFRRLHCDLTNNLKLIKTDLGKKIKIEEPGFSANAEIGLKLVLMSESVKEVPISWINRTYDMGHSSFRVIGSGGGYLRILTVLALRTLFGLKPLDR